MRVQKILFYVSEVAHFWDSIKPLFNAYVNCGEDVECTVVFPLLEKIQEVGRGTKNVDRVRSIAAEIESFAKCFYYDEWDREQGHYDICFTYSDYIGIGSEIRKCCQYIVAVQVTAIYTHIYVGVSGLKQLFGAQNNENIDYWILSDFVADWISRKVDLTEDKLLRFGYPRLDDLYSELNEPIEISEEWSKKIKGRKVFLVVGANDYPYWLTQIKSGVILYRPHPFQIEREEEEGILRQLSSMENVIIDNTDTYYQAFKISDAMISTVLCSLYVNYLMTDKPILLLDEKRFDRRTQYVNDYNEDPWYKACYIARTDKDISDFIDMVNRGGDILREVHMQYRIYIQKNFDGMVCQRIVEYFKNKDEG